MEMGRLEGRGYAREVRRRILQKKKMKYDKASGVDTLKMKRYTKAFI